MATESLYLSHGEPFRGYKTIDTTARTVFNKLRSKVSRAKMSLWGEMPEIIFSFVVICGEKNPKFNKS